MTSPEFLNRMPESVSIVKAPGKGMNGMFVGGAILVLGLVLAGILFAAGSPIAGGIVGLVVLVIGGAWLKVLIGVGTGIGKPLLTVGADGVTCPSFHLPWGRITAMEFKDARVTYLRDAPTRTVAVPNEQRSLVVTTTDRDRNGRPVQYGTTLYGLHSENYDEIRAAARRFSPTIQFWTVVAASDYTLDSARVNGFLDRLAREGRIEVVDKRGKPRATITTEGISTDGATLRWADTASVLAYTYVHTSTGGFTTTSRSPRLAFGLVAVGGDGQRQSFQFTKGRGYLDYPKDYSPTIEEFSAILQRVAPRIQFADQRTSDS